MSRISIEEEYDGGLAACQRQKPPTNEVRPETPHGTAHQAAHGCRRLRETRRTAIERGADPRPTSARQRSVASIASLHRQRPRAAGHSTCGVLHVRGMPIASGRHQEAPCHATTGTRTENRGPVLADSLRDRYVPPVVTIRSGVLDGQRPGRGSNAPRTAARLGVVTRRAAGCGVGGCASALRVKTFPLRTPALRGVLPH